MNDRPLILLVEETRNKITQDVSKAISESRLPGYLIEGIITDILSDIRSRKNMELMAALSEVISQKESNDEKESNDGEE